MTPGSIELVRPDWPLPTRVRACATTRRGGVSGAPWHSLNLAGHVGDDLSAVAQNRELLAHCLALPSEPLWLDQVHGTRVRDAGDDDVCADACYADAPGRICAVLTADCLPVLFSSRAGDQVAAAHAGWRGLLAGVLEETLSRFRGPRDGIVAWLGPAIGPRAFEVGDEVRTMFVDEDDAARSHFAANRPGHWLADLYGLARLRLARAGVGAVYGGDCCTYGEATRFFSYRRDGVTGRMASLIWLQP